MRSIPVLAVLLLSAGCKKEFTSVDEACDDRVRGDAPDTSGLHEAVIRANCYRRLVGLDEIGTHAGLQQAVTDHLDYMIVNETTADAEDPDESGFTGEDTWTRLEANGVPLENLNGWPLSGEGDEDSLDTTPTDIIDAMVFDPWARQVVLQPGAAAMGFGLQQGWFHIVELFQWPTGEAIRSPAVYPADGQTGVPLAMQVPLSPTIDFGLPAGQELGYPITITVGSFSTAFDGVNPYGLVASDVTLTGPEGDLELHVLQPGDGDLALLFSIIVASDVALSPSSEYTLSAHLEWIDGTADVLSTFTTAAE